MDLYSVLIYVLSYVGFFTGFFYILSLYSYYANKKELVQIEKSPFVTVIIPAYNEQGGIEDTIRSALSLNYPRDKFEVIVVDDGSKDKTFDLASKFKQQGVRVFSKKNGGKGSALNLGLKNAKGVYVATMDADTIVQPDVLLKMLPYFENKQVMSVTPSMGVYKPRSIWQRVQQIEYYLGVFLRKSFASINAIHITPGAFSVYRKSFFDKYGGYDEHNITEDMEIALRIQSHNFIIENEPRAAIYTLAPKSFRALLVQRRRWYTGLVKNLWAYRRLFGLKKGPLGFLVLPVSVTAVLLGCFLTIYSTSKLIGNLKNEFSYLIANNFRFYSFTEINLYALERLFYIFFSYKVFLITLIFILFVSGYLFFAKKNMLYRDGLKLNFIFFIVLYSFMFTIWWIVSFLYLAFNKKVVWRSTAT